MISMGQTYCKQDFIVKSQQDGHFMNEVQLNHEDAYGV